MESGFLNNRTALLSALALVSFIVLILPYSWIAVAALILVFLLYRYKRYFILISIILAYLVVTGDEAEKIRSVINIIALGALIVLFLQNYGFITKDYPKVPAEIIRFLAFLFFTLFISSVFSIDNLSGAVSILRMAVFFGICYIFYSFIENKKTIYIYIAALFISVAVLGGSIFVSLAGSGFSFLMLQGNLARFAGFYENPNYAGLLLVVSVPFLISLFFFDSFKPFKMKALLIIFLLINLIILLLADSRASMLSITVSGIFIIFTLNRPLFFKIFFSALVVFLILLFIPPVQDFISLFLRLNRISNRDYFWSTGIDIIKAYPVFGVGPDMFQKYFFTYMPSAVTRYYSSGAWIVGKPHPHNFFLFFTAENGILGFISAVYFWILFFYLAVKTLKLSRPVSKNVFIISVAVTSIGIGVLIRSFFEITGYLTYGFITRDLPFWLAYIILIFIYSRLSTGSTKELA